ncbi:MAG: uracil-DNA glycosylase [Alkalispirochaeta sp.]
MNSDTHFESLFQILVEAEELLSGSRASDPEYAMRSYEARVAAMNAHGWDVPHDSSADGPASVDHPPQDSQPSDPPTVDPQPPVVGLTSASPDSSGSERLSASADLVSSLSPEDRRRRLDEIASRVRTCEACPLSMGRTEAVPGEGALDPMVMIVGEGPGYHEDLQGRPFVGKAGHYLDKWLESIGLTREESAFIANIVKCRPPNNRDPKPEEIDVCSPYLKQQIALVRPRMIVTVGRISTRILTGSTQGITRIHGTFFRYEGIPLVPTFHPSAVLRNPAYRRPVWEDLKKVRNWLIDHAGHRPESIAE